MSGVVVSIDWTPEQGRSKLYVVFYMYFILQTTPPLGDGESEDGIDCDSSQGNQGKGCTTSIRLQCMRQQWL